MIIQTLANWGEIRLDNKRIKEKWGINEDSHLAINILRGSEGRCVNEETRNRIEKLSR